MDIQQYISSGVLELYVLGQLPAQEMQEVDALRVQYPEIDSEIFAIENAIENLALVNAKKAPSRVKQNVIAQITEASQSESTVTVPKNIETPKASQLGFYRNWAMAASVALLLLAAYLLNMQQKVNSLSIDVASLQKNLTTANADLAVYTNPAYQKINLASTDTTNKSNVAQVYWNKANNEVYISLAAQQKLGADEQYQLWALADGKPIDAGVLDSDGKLQKAKSIVSAQAFAITIEKKGGSPTPTLTALVAMGKI
jgi:anti-sigma-K factor RskA